MTTTPLIVLVTGVSGAGKTAITGQLREFGYDAVSLDGYPNMCGWTDAGGNPVTRPDQPGLGWLARHNWSWNREALTELIAQKRASGDDLVWLAGVASNTAQLAHLFDLRILLHVTKPVMRQRLHDTARSNDFGRAGATGQLLEQRFDIDQQQLSAICDTSVDATAPLQQVGHDLLIAAGFGILHRDAPSDRSTQ